MTRVTKENYQELDGKIRAIVDQVSLQVADRNKNFSIDPLTIIMIANCIISIIRLLYMCYSRDSTATLEGLRKPTRFQKWLINTQVRRYAAKEYSADIVNSVKEHSQDMVDEDIVHIINLYHSGQLFKWG